MGQVKAFKHVAVLMGGISAERDISLRSGAAAAAGLRACGYAVTTMDLQSEHFTLPDGIDVVFLALHGTFGEDGKIQALLDTKGIPYTGSGAVASRTAMDKAAAKLAWQRAGVPTAPFCVLSEGACVSFPLPAVVKPVSQGSSIGVHLVREEGEWAAALADAFRYDARVMVEAYVPGRELTVGILDDEALPVVEIVAADGWYGFGAKYTPGQTRYVVPAEISGQVARHLQKTALDAFRVLGCTGFGRVDFRLPPDGDPMVLEVNTIPGLTETSLLPKAAAVAGICFGALCERILVTAGCAGEQGGVDA
ncbi:MAG: D-alanine--D-alanine ligase [Kiritimatiellia bacterium]